MEFVEAEGRCVCPGGAGLDAAGVCVTCASGIVSEGGVCMADCYSVGANYYLESTNSASSGSAAVRVCKECAGVILTAADGTRSCVAVADCPTTITMVNGVPKCLAQLPEVAERYEYSSELGGLVKVEANVPTGKVLVKQVRNVAGKVFQLFSDGSQRLIY